MRERGHQTETQKASQDLGLKGSSSGNLAASPRPSVDKGTLRPVELLAEPRIVALHHRQLGEALGVAAEQPRVRLEMLRPAAPPGQTRCAGGPGAGEGHERVRKAPEIDSGALAELDPIRIREDSGGWGGEMVAPMPRVSRPEDGARVPVGARRDHVEFSRPLVSE